MTFFQIDSIYRNALAFFLNHPHTPINYLNLFLIWAHNGNQLEKSHLDIYEDSLCCDPGINPSALLLHASPWNSQTDFREKDH